MTKRIIIKVSLILISIIFILAGVITYIIVSANHEYVKENKRDKTQSTTQVPKEYEALLNIKDHSLTEKYTIHTSTNNPITEFYLDSNYFVGIYKIGQINTSLNTAIKEMYSDFEDPLGSFRGINGEHTDHNPYFFYFRTGQSHFNNEVYFNLYGNGTHLINKDDTLAYYRSNFRRFSISYSQYGNPDIYGVIKRAKKDASLPIELLFLKRNSNLYLFILTTNNGALSANTLLKLINKK